MNWFLKESLETEANWTQTAQIALQTYWSNLINEITPIYPI